MAVYPLPPGVRAETFVHANGQEITIYRAPYASDGPRLVVEDRREVLYFMYAAYVFRWPKGATQLDIGHGAISRHMALWRDVSVSGRWSPEALARFAVAWSHREFSKFSG